MEVDLRKSIAMQTSSALSLATHLFSTSPSPSSSSNLVFSPLTIHAVLALIAAGSDGPTRDQLLTFLGSDSPDRLRSFVSQAVEVVLADGGPSGGPTLSFASGLWVEKSLSLKDSFKQLVCSVYKAAANAADFKNKAAEVAVEVNKWAESKTNGLIKDVLSVDSVDASTRLIFANALYFKGAWGDKFNAAETKEHEFFLLDGSAINAPFMTSKKKQAIRAFDDFKVLALQYKQGEDKRRFSMYFFLPNARDGLPALVEKFGSGSKFLDTHLPYQKVEVGEFRLPKFKISFGFEASELLQKLGLVLPFSGGGLTEMVDSPEGKDLYVSKVFHKAFIEVNEEGTEAAAASAMVANLRCLSFPEKEDFVADHPFLFVAREDITGMVLFIGQVLNPSLV